MVKERLSAIFYVPVKMGSQHLLVTSAKNPSNPVLLSQIFQDLFNRLEIVGYLIVSDLTLGYLFTSL